MSPAKGKKKILIAEDERPMAKALKLKLEGEGYEVFNAYDGNEALAIINEHTLDIVLLDIMMPRKNGFEVLTEMKTLKRKMPPVFVLSNLSQEVDNQKALELGATGFVIKSNTPLSQIVKKIKDII